MNDRTTRCEMFAGIEFQDWLNWRLIRAVLEQRCNSTGGGYSALFGGLRLGQSKREKDVGQKYEDWSNLGCVWFARRSVASFLNRCELPPNALQKTRNICHVQGNTSDGLTYSLAAMLHPYITNEQFRLPGEGKKVISHAKVGASSARARYVMFEHRRNVLLHIVYMVIYIYGGRI